MLWGKGLSALMLLLVPLSMCMLCDNNKINNKAACFFIQGAWQHHEYKYLKNKLKGDIHRRYIAKPEEAI